MGYFVVDLPGGSYYMDTLRNTTAPAPEADTLDWAAWPVAKMRGEPLCDYLVRYNTTGGERGVGVPLGEALGDELLCVVMVHAWAVQLHAWAACWEECGLKCGLPPLLPGKLCRLPQCLLCASPPCPALQAPPPAAAARRRRAERSPCPSLRVMPACSAIEDSLASGSHHELHHAPITLPASCPCAPPSRPFPHTYALIRLPSRQLC